MELQLSGFISLSDARKIIAACHVHATDLLSAAERLLSEPATPNLAYHLALLGLEEIGKARLVGSKAAVGTTRDTSRMDKWLSSHSRKLWWALWMPLEKIDPAKFYEAKIIAERMHIRRLAALYVDPSIEAPLPREAVSIDETRSLIELTESLLPTIDQVDTDIDADRAVILEWFLQTVDEQESARRLFSAPFLAKYEELGGDTARWVDWAKGEFERLAAEAVAAMRQEMSRQPGAADRAKWRIRTRVYTPSHTLRPKVLKFWNDRIDVVKLVYNNKKDELSLELTLTESVTLPELHGRALSVTKMLLAFLSIGSTGYFWFERPACVKPVFERIDDIDKPGFRVELGPQRADWISDRPMPLTEQYLHNAMVCMSIFVPMGERAAEPIFGPYFHGLGLLAKSDAHVSTDDLAQTSFNASLRAALRHYGAWDGAEASLRDALDKAFQAIIPDAENRQIVFGSLNAGSSSGQSPISEATVMAKRLTDLFLIKTAQEQYQQKLQGWEGSQTTRLDGGC